MATELGEIREIARGSVASVHTFRHGPRRHRDPDEEVYPAHSVVFTSSGRWGLSTSEGSVDVDPRTMVIGRPGRAYRARHDERVPADLTWYVDFDAPVVSKPYPDDWLARLGGAPFERAWLPLTPRLDMVGRALWQEATTRRPAFEVRVDLLALELLIEIVRAGGQAAEISAIPATAREQIEASLRYIDQHLGEDLTVATIARAAAMSPFHFSRVFAAHAGSPPHRYLVRARLQLAARLLRETPLTVTQVADRTGFRSPSHFASVFRRHVGVSPSDYRRG